MKNKLYLFPYADYGGMMLLVKARDERSARRKVKNYLPAIGFSEPELVKFEKDIVNLGYWGE